MQAQMEELPGKPGCRSCAPFWKMKSRTGRASASANPTRRVRWGSSRVNVVFGWTRDPAGRPRVRTPRARKWSWRATSVQQDRKTCNERCGNAWGGLSTLNTRNNVSPIVPVWTTPPPCVPAPLRCSFPSCCNWTDKLLQLHFLALAGSYPRPFQRIFCPAKTT